MSNPIYCPACGKKMDTGSAGDEPWVIMWLQCAKCGLRSDTYGAATHRGAAIKAGRAMRRICHAVDVRVAQDILRMLNDRKLTRAQIRERVRQVACAL